MSPPRTPKSNREPAKAWFASFSGLMSSIDEVRDVVLASIEESGHSKQKYLDPLMAMEANLASLRQLNAQSAEGGRFQKDANGNTKFDDVKMQALLNPVIDDAKILGHLNAIKDAVAAIRSVSGKTFKGAKSIPLEFLTANCDTLIKAHNNTMKDAQLNEFKDFYRKNIDKNPEFANYLFADAHKGWFDPKELKGLDDNYLKLKDHFTQGKGLALVEQMNTIRMQVLEIEGRARQEGFADRKGHSVIFKNNNLEFKEFLDNAALANLLGGLRTTAAELLSETKDSKTLGILENMSLSNSLFESHAAKKYETEVRYFKNFYKEQKELGNDLSIASTTVKDDISNSSTPISSRRPSISVSENTSQASAEDNYARVMDELKAKLGGKADVQPVVQKPPMGELKVRNKLQIEMAQQQQKTETLKAQAPLVSSEQLVRNFMLPPIKFPTPPQRPMPMEPPPLLSEVNAMPKLKEVAPAAPPLVEPAAPLPLRSSAEVIASLVAEPVKPAPEVKAAIDLDAPPPPLMSEAIKAREAKVEQVLPVEPQKTEGLELEGIELFETPENEAPKNEVSQEPIKMDGLDSSGIDLDFDIPENDAAANVENVTQFAAEQQAPEIPDVTPLAETQAEIVEPIPDAPPMTPVVSAPSEPIPDAPPMTPVETAPPANDDEEIEMTATAVQHPVVMQRSGILPPLPPKEPVAVVVSLNTEPVNNGCQVVRTEPMINKSNLEKIRSIPHILENWNVSDIKKEGAAPFIQIENIKNPEKVISVYTDKITTTCDSQDVYVKMLEAWKATHAEGKLPKIIAASEASAEKVKQAFLEVYPTITPPNIQVKSEKAAAAVAVHKAAAPAVDAPANDDKASSLRM